MTTPDFFGLLGQPRQYVLDRDALEDAYLQRAAATHPDKFADADSGRQRQAMETSAATNEAYRVLRDPVRRAEYLVKLGGVDLDSTDSETGAPQMSQAFLMEMIEQRERVDDARAKGEDALEDVRDAVEDERKRALTAAVSQIEAGDIRAAALSLVVRRYQQRLLDEIDNDEP